MTTRELQAERCASCRFWDPQAWAANPYENFGECAAASKEPGKGADVMITATCASEGIGGELLTRADFGCILHEPKAAPFNGNRIGA